MFVRRSGMNSEQCESQWTHTHNSAFTVFTNISTKQWITLHAIATAPFAVHHIHTYTVYEISFECFSAAVISRGGIHPFSKNKNHFAHGAEQWCESRNSLGCKHLCTLLQWNIIIIVGKSCHLFEFVFFFYYIFFIDWHRCCDRRRKLWFRLYLHPKNWWNNKRRDNKSSILHL